MGCILGKHQRSKSSPTPVTAVAVAAVSNSNNLGRTLEKPALALATGRRSSASSQDVSNGGVIVAAATNNNGRAAVAATDGNDERRDAEASTGRAGGDGGEQRERRRSGRDRERQSHATSNANNDRHDAGIGNLARPVREKTGWPKWLTDVAGDAIKGLVPRRADTYQKLEKIGQGTYSNVYKARDLHSGKIVALKKVRFDNMEPESVKFMAREILVLRKLNHPNIIKFEGLVTSRMACSLYLVFEYMEHDLAGLAASPGIEFTESQVKCYMHQLLSGIEHCHTNGVLHRDIKGSNLLLDNEGILKIADFGLAAFFDPRNKQPMTSRVVTLWYRPPELLLGATEYGVGVDLWSAGCILAELLAGKPIMPGRTEVEQLHKIFKLCGSPTDEYWKRTKLPHATLFKPQQPYKRCIKETFKDFPPSALSLIETLLAIDPDERGTATAALHSEFFTTEPFACDPSSLPQYPPSKEMDAKLRDEEARRQRAGDAKTHANEARKTRNREQRGGRAVAAPEANAEVQANIQRRRMISQTNAKSKSEKFPPPHQDGAVGFPMAPSRHEHPLMEPQSCSYLMAPITSYSGPLGNPATVGPSRRKKRNSAEVRVAPSRVNRPSVAMSLADPRRKGKEAIAVDV